MRIIRSCDAPLAKRPNDLARRIIYLGDLVVTETLGPERDGLAVAGNLRRPELARGEPGLKIQHRKERTLYRKQPVAIGGLRL